jgi:antitoxin MazE
VAELVDATDLKSVDLKCHPGSIPGEGTSKLEWRQFGAHADTLFSSAAIRDGPISRIDTSGLMYILVDTWRRSMSKTATLTVQQWGNSLAVRIPAAVARSARFKVGQPVEVSAQDSNVLVRSIGEPKLTLEQKLAAFDPVLHGGEVMATGVVGKEIL